MIVKASVGPIFATLLKVDMEKNEVNYILITCLYSSLLFNAVILQFWNRYLLENRSISILPQFHEQNRTEIKILARLN